MARFRSLLAKSMFALLIVSGTLSTNMQAQDDAVTVTVPFKFVVGTQSIAPGTYQFRLTSNQFLLSVTNVKTGDVEVFHVRPERQSKIEKHGHLNFRHSSGRNVLDEVHFPSTDTFSELIEQRRSSRIETARSQASTSASAQQR